MGNTVGIIRSYELMSLEEQSKLIKRVCGDIPIEAVDWQTVHQVQISLNRLKTAGYKTIVVQSVARLSRQWVYLQQILITFYKLGINLQVIDHERLVDVEITAGERYVSGSVKINGVYWLSDIII
jgi:hypothetical protein